MAMARKVTLNKTYAQMQSLIAANKLDTQTCYKITDRGDRGMVFRAATTNQLEFDGIRYMLCPTTYKAETDAFENVWIGVWNAVRQESFTENCLTIWNGLVWKAGVEISGESPDSVDSGWTEIPKATFENHEYTEMVFGITYDFTKDWISKQWDTYNNKYGLLKEYNQLMFGNLINRIDWCDWNFNTSGYFMFNNTKELCYNNSNTGHIANNSGFGYIFGNSNGGNIWNNGNSGANNGSIYNNSCGGHIYDNFNKGGIYGNSCASIYFNINAGSIYNNENLGSINKNSNLSSINGNSSLGEATCNIQDNGPGTDAITGVWDADVTDAVVDKTGSAS